MIVIISVVLIAVGCDLVVFVVVFERWENVGFGFSFGLGLVEVFGFMRGGAQKIRKNSRSFINIQNFHTNATSR